jgi:hypothetical protein
MTAVEAMARARAAGLMLLPDPAGLRVRGPKEVRSALLPELAPFAGEILRLLAPGKNATVAGPTVTDWSSREPCNGCGRDNWIVSVVMEYGARLCPRCWTSGGARNADIVASTK